MSASPAIEPAAPVKGPDIIDHLKSSERLMTARELASILAISPKTIYSYAERNMIPHFKIEASVRFRGRDVVQAREPQTSEEMTLVNIASEGTGFQRTGMEHEHCLSN